MFENWTIRRIFDTPRKTRKLPRLQNVFVRTDASRLYFNNDLTRHGKRNKLLRRRLRETLVLLKNVLSSPPIKKFKTLRRNETETGVVDFVLFCLSSVPAPRNALAKQVLRAYYYYIPINDRRTFSKTISTSIMPYQTHSTVCFRFGVVKFSN